MKALIVAVVVAGMTGCTTMPSSMPITDQEVSRVLNEYNRVRTRVESRGVHDSHREQWLYNCLMGIRNGCRMMGD